MSGAPCGKPVAAQVRDLDAVDDDRARRRRVDSGNQVQQRGLAAAAGAHQRQELGAGDLQIDAVERPDDVSHQVIATALPGPAGERYCWYQCTIRGGREGRDVDAITLAQICEKLGAGEVLLNCIDRDGTKLGFDIELIDAVKKSVSIPVIASSGAGAVEHFHEVFAKTRVESARASSYIPTTRARRPYARRTWVTPTVGSPCNSARTSTSASSAPSCSRLTRTAIGPRY